MVNEPVAEDGDGLRDSLWSRTLGDLDHIVRAFDHAAEADPNAVLFINDYNLESRPKKRAAFMRLVEGLLKRGCKIGGLGTQTHIDIDLPKGAVAAPLKDLASFGLPIHLSELDISTNMKRVDVRSVDERLRLQAGQAAEAAEAFMALPARAALRLHPLGPARQGFMAAGIGRDRPGGQAGDVRRSGSGQAGLQRPVGGVQPLGGNDSGRSASLAWRMARRSSLIRKITR